MSALYKRLTWKASLLTTILSLLFTVALAASGDLDTTFSGDGLVTSYAVPSNPGRSDYGFDIAIQPNGKIVAVGASYVPSTGNSDFAILRYNTRGSLDATFSGDGRLITNFGGFDRASGVAIQSNGKIVAGGEKCSSSIGPCDVALVRYNANGTFDTTFSGDGKLTSDFGGGNNSAYSVVIQSNGKIVLAGSMWNGTDNDFAVYRYLSNGSLDVTFSGDGMVSFGFGAGRQDSAADLVLQSDGKIVVAGYSGDVNHINNNFAIARLNANGSLDTTFSGDGRQAANFGGNDFGAALTLQPDGKIVVAGRKNDLTRSSFALARFNPDGNPDTTFNGTGRKTFSIIPSTAADAAALDVSVQVDGKIVVAGHTEIGGDNDHAMALVRLNSTGGFDMTFSGDGKVTIDFGADDYLSALVLQPADGKYVLAGQTYNGTQSDFALARVLP
jgi:uncharacterized delta-60 repeat protein